jgi:predicted Rossmann fold nucleotide-binding protein DprA/Smf involved in DNA uptake
MEKTIDIIKKTRKVSDAVKEKMKEFNKIKRPILKALETEEKTIPQIAKETGILFDVVTYHLMTLQKYGNIEAGEIDDMDEFFFYKLKK